MHVQLIYAQLKQRTRSRWLQRSPVGRLLLALVLVLGAGTVTPALALGLAEARSSGLVGEQSNGYLASVSASPRADVKALVQSINSKRRNAYTDRARKAGVSLDIMEQRVGQRLIDKLTPGQFYRVPGQNWQKK